MHVRSLAVLALLAAASSASAAVVTFDTAASPLATVYEAPGTPPGSLAFTEDGIAMRTANFTSGGGAFIGYNFSDIIGPGMFVTRSANVNNIQWRADFTSLPFLVTQASFEWVDQGGSENLGVNGVYLELQDLEDAPAVINGVNVVVALGGPGHRGTVTFSSPAGINNIIMGGQEFTIDNVIALPTPGAAALLGLGGLLATRRKR